MMSVVLPWFERAHLAVMRGADYGHRFASWRHLQPIGPPTELSHHAAGAVRTLAGACASQVPQAPPSKLTRCDMLDNVSPDSWGLFPAGGNDVLPALP